MTTDKLGLVTFFHIIIIIVFNAYHPPKQEAVYATHTRDRDLFPVYDSRIRAPNQKARRSSTVSRTTVVTIQFGSNHGEGKLASRAWRCVVLYCAGLTNTLLLEGLVVVVVVVVQSICCGKQASNGKIGATTFHRRAVHVVVFEHPLGTRSPGPDFL